nr:NAD(P)H-dependent oxidoreductase subunit E [Pseudonocardiales bacterium]
MDLRLTQARANESERAAVDAVLGAPAAGSDDHFADAGHAARGRRHLLLPALHAVQESIGWISEGALNHIAQRLSVPPAEIYGVATFYAMFATEPRAPRVVHVCDDIACGPAGGEAMIERLTAELG